MRRRVLAVFIVLGLSATACSGAPAHRSSARSSTTLGQSPATLDQSPTTSTAESSTTAPPATVSTTTTTTAPSVNPDVVPSVITPAYVDAVMKKLDHIYGNAVRLEVATKDIPPQVITDLRAIYADPLYQKELQIFSQGLILGLSSVKSHPGDPVVTVDKLESASGSCIFARVTTSLSAVTLRASAPPADEYLMLRRVVPRDNPQFINGTPWQIAYDRTFTTATRMASKCRVA